MTSVMNVNECDDVPRWWTSANEAGDDDDRRGRYASEFKALS